mgnify:CR=1 FL=1
MGSARDRLRSGLSEKNRDDARAKHRSANERPGRRAQNTFLWRSLLRCA